MKHARLALVMAMTSLAATPAIAASLTMLQFGSFESREEAEKRLSELNIKHAKALKPLASSVREIALSPENLTVYRAQAGPIADRKAAQDVCAALASGGDECYIVNTAMVAAEQLPAPVQAQAAPAVDGAEKSSIQGAGKEPAIAAASMPEAKPIVDAVPVVDAGREEKIEQKIAQKEDEKSKEKTEEKREVKAEEKIEKAQTEKESDIKLAQKMQVADEVVVAPSIETKKVSSVFDAIAVPVETGAVPTVVAVAAPAADVPLPPPPSIASVKGRPDKAMPPIKPIETASAHKKFTIDVKPESATVTLPDESPVAEKIGNQSAGAVSAATQNPPETMMVLPPPPPPLPHVAAPAKSEKNADIASAPASAGSVFDRVIEVKDNAPAPFVAVLPPAAVPTVTATAQTQALPAPAPKAPGFWSRVNPFDSAHHPSADQPKPVPTALAPMPAVNALSPTVVVPMVSAFAPSMPVAPTSPTEPARLLPLPAEDMAARPHIGSLPVPAVMPVPAPSVPVVQAAIEVPAAPPVLPVPPSPVVVRNTGVNVEEAKRVPLSEMPAPPSPAVPQPPATTRPAQLPISMSPSVSEGTKTVWAQIGPFADATAAYAYWTNYRQAHPDFPVVRARVVAGYQQKLHGVDQSYLRIGPVARKGFVGYLCSGVPRESQLQCGVITDLGLASAMDASADAFQSQRYAH